MKTGYLSCFFFFEGGGGGGSSVTNAAPAEASQQPFSYVIFFSVTNPMQSNTDQAKKFCCF